MNEYKMSFEDMISALDTAVGMLLIPSMKDPLIKDVVDMISNVSVSLGEWAEEEI